MESFKLWLEENQADIRYIGHSEYAGQAWVIFSINGKRYEYDLAPNLLNGRKFKALVRYAPGEALNYAKEKGTLIPSKPKTSSKPMLSPIPRADWQAEPTTPKQQTRFDF
jgi:hypothetical protein